MQRHNTFAISVAGLLLVACGGRAGDDESTGGPNPFPGGVDSDTGTFSSSGGGERFDLGGGNTDGASGGGAEGGPSGCEKVDFLFVIDNSNSMGTNQAELIASFPEFVDGIQNALVGVNSYHVGVVSSDPYAHNEAGCQDMGALVTQTSGRDSSNANCGPFAGGGRYMTEADDLPNTFACAAQVGTSGENDEKMLEAALEAVSTPLNDAGACNAGFVRDDALLVVTFITDEDDPGTCVGGGSSCEGSPGDPASWAQDFIDIKGGNVQNMVALALVRGAPNNACGSPQGTEKDGARIMELATQFGSNGFIGDICASSFGPFFEEAISVIESACGDFVPPG